MYGTANVHQVARGQAREQQGQPAHRQGRHHTGPSSLKSLRQARDMVHVTWRKWALVEGCPWWALPSLLAAGTLQLSDQRPKNAAMHKRRSGHATRSARPLYTLPPSRCPSPCPRRRPRPSDNPAAPPHLRATLAAARICARCAASPMAAPILHRAVPRTFVSAPMQQLKVPSAVSGSPPVTTFARCLHSGKCVRVQQGQRRGWSWW